MPAESGPGPWLLISGDRSALAPRGGQPVLFCPWDESGGYSYRYDGVDERIDQLLLSPGPLGGRITSYNVCYTKLLRSWAYPSRLGSPS